MSMNKPPLKVWRNKGKFAKVWDNRSVTGEPYLSFEFGKSIKNKDGSYSDYSVNFYQDELPHALSVLSAANVWNENHEYIVPDVPEEEEEDLFDDEL